MSFRPGAKNKGTRICFSVDLTALFLSFVKVIRGVEQKGNPVNYQ